MKLSSIKFGLAAACAVGMTWILCSIMVLLLPSTSLNLGGYMIHVDLSNISWQMGYVGFLLGLILWTLMAGIIASLTAIIYNEIV